MTAERIKELLAFIDMGKLPRLSYQEVADLVTAAEEVGGLREPVRWFAQHMETQLKANDHKGGWKGDRIGSLFDRMLDEERELFEVIGTANNEAIIREAADVANFAMMIADIARDALENDGHAG